uniref:NADH-ubiquinone oxidoreductase chain 3 n=1 Tax=Heteropteryx dilatata TaxID=173795 RepID=E2RV15_HETDI|nr:NADH dehydrogenase subunit 3 [Heteropteryx dilatata]BAJ24549.1 NADH dehydrogenase subunit 3 [Heteropteryx dilatata]
MNSTTIMMMITIMLTNIIMMLNIILSKKTITDREKSSPFECGFDPKSSSRMPFSLKFFLIAAIFLIFDIEIALLLPMMPTMMMTKMYYWMETTTIFILILIMGLYHEWNQGALNWAK